jgi:glycosyltransferase involved in cell wall biosynthesis
MHIAILGTRGIPNHYGGFEQFAEYLSLGLVKAGHKVTVYNSHTHPFQEKEWNGVTIIHQHDPENKMGTFGQFLYDFNCIRHARKQHYDIILILGYTSSSIWGWYYPRKRSVITTNMDGLEWKRTKYSPPVRQFLKFAERLGAYYSDYLIADSVGIQEYLLTKYNRSSVYIPYGATIFEQPDVSYLAKYGVTPYNYDLLIARMEPENNIEIILDGKVAEKGNRKFLVIGKHQKKFGEYLKAKYATVDNIIFLGGIYNIEILNNLRYFSNLYFHGHAVGGTNPSLLEAMASNCFICAHDNVFSKSILGTDALYFSTAADVSRVLTTAQKANDDTATMINNNTAKIRTTYPWDHIIQQYMSHFEEICRR